MARAERGREDEPAAPEYDAYPDTLRGMPVAHDPGEEGDRRAKREMDGRRQKREMDGRRRAGYVESARRDGGDAGDGGDVFEALGLRGRRRRSRTWAWARAARVRDERL